MFNMKIQMSSDISTWYFSFFIFLNSCRFYKVQISTKPFSFCSSNLKFPFGNSLLGSSNLG